MTEKEKMLAHEWYDANFDEELRMDSVLKTYALNIIIRDLVIEKNDKRF